MKYILQNNKSNYYEIVDSIISKRKSEVFSFFNSEEISLPFDIYIYNTIEDLVKGLRERGFDKDPDYMCACHKDRDNSLNFFEPKENPSDKEWSKEEYEKVVFHELIHGIQFTLFGWAPEWLYEGIAKYLDGTYSKGIKWLLENYINNSIIPNQNEIENEFGMHDYDSYDYAYLMVSYLIETNGKEKLIEILKDTKQLNNYMDNLLNNTIGYYNNKYGLSTNSKRK